MSAANPPAAKPSAAEDASDLAVIELGFALDLTHGLADALETSLVAANRQALASLSGDAYDTFEWPTNIDDYFDFLRSFARRTSTAASDGSEDTGDRVRHFYLLLEQPAEDGSLVRDNEAMAKWLAVFATTSELLSQPV